MSYPQITEYQDAVQDPRNTFTDPVLKAGAVAASPLGLPMPMSGGFALTYKLQSGQKKFAVRCFHREVPQAQERYARISAKLRSLASPYFVIFDFQPGGIRINGRTYPVVKMDWVEGDTLGIYLDRKSLTPTVLGNLRQGFGRLAEFLERNGIAHGDIQNENVIVSGSELRLIDYDGMFVTGMTEGRGSEVGHKHFQHPGRTTKLFGPRMDRFSFIILDVSFEAMQADASLHRKFSEGGQAIIFKANDFADPTSSQIFRMLNGLPSLRESAKKLAAICCAPVESVPTLADFKAGRNIPISAVPAIGVPKPVVASVYIGAFDVVDAKDFNAVLRRVGDKIELVGQIISVKRGVGKRGRGKDRPYCFINFGIWNKESVKITIWSEGLDSMSNRYRPSEAWVGKWISVTGLVEPVYNGSHYGRPYRNIGITVVSDNQIIQLSEQEAKFRLGRGPCPNAKRATEQEPVETAKPKNSQIINDILKRRPSWTEPSTATASPPSPPWTMPPPSPPPPAPAPPPTIPPKSGTPPSRNQDILRTIQGMGSSPLSSPPPQSPAPIVTTPGLLSRVLPWIWIAAVILGIIFLARSGFR
jgi:hypothetical protein